MVVFAGSIAKVIRIAALTQLPLYYHGLKDKQKQLIEFMRSSSAIITISSGINIPNLSIVLHLPIAIHGLMEFSQESSTFRHALLDVQDFLASPSGDPTKSHCLCSQPPADSHHGSAENWQNQRVRSEVRLMADLNTLEAESLVETGPSFN
jgi:hypothetical protein